MMRFIRWGDRVIAESISRFAKNARDLLELVEQLCYRTRKRDRCYLLRPVDALDTYQPETALDAFTAEYRLADGIHREPEGLGTFSAYEEERSRR